MDPHPDEGGEQYGVGLLEPSSLSTLTFTEFSFVFIAIFLPEEGSRRSWVKIPGDRETIARKRIKSNFSFILILFSLDISFLIFNRRIIN